MGLFSNGTNGAQEPLLLVEDESCSSGVVECVVDYKGEKAFRSSSGGWKSAFLVMASEVFERLACFGIYSNLIVYLTGPLGQSTATAAANVNAWLGAGFILPLLGAYIADSVVGIYRAIIYFTVLYIVVCITICPIIMYRFHDSFSAALKNEVTQGLGMMTFSALEHSSSSSSPPLFEVIFFFTSLYLVAIAQGGRKPCTQAFAADQFDIQDPSERRSKSSFFNWWYCALSIGMALAYTIMSYIQENLGWALGFGIPCACMVVSLLFVLVGSKIYRYSARESQKNPFARIAKVFIAAAKNWRRFAPSTFNNKEVQESERSSYKFNFFDKALIDNELSENQVGEAKAIVQLAPIWCTCLIYSIVSAQTSTFYTKQGSTMDRKIGANLKIPAASLSSFINIGALVTLPIYDRLFVPFAKGITRKPNGITTLQRIGSGMFLSILVMVVSAIVENRRLRTAAEHGLVDTPGATVPMSVWWLLPQYILFGVSTAFVYVGSQQFFYDEVPNGLKSMGLALNYSIVGVGSFLSGFLVSAIEKITSVDGRGSWFPINLNEGHLDYFYWFLCGLDVIGLFAFIYFSKSYIYSNGGIVDVLS
ncbi:hypothetical protein Sjap_021440 [Stephania japonica]|uniref:Protein NRT1/ PTR FAMILY 5.10-like n=1 Tax=Stephania japonica TaxID=461633 RepID=A0AAP0ESL4_9MAGN